MLGFKLVVAKKPQFGEEGDACCLANDVSCLTISNTDARVMYLLHT